MQMLLEHAWPGNVRELDHAVERAVLMAQDELVRARDLGLRTPKDAVARIEARSPRRRETSSGRVAYRFCRSAGSAERS